MHLNDILSEKNMSKYRLAKESGIPKTTIIDICSQKADIRKCSVETIYRIAKVLEVPMETLVRDEIEATDYNANHPSFDIFKSNICHLVKDKGDIEFVIETLSSDEIRALYRRGWYAEAFYLLAMVDYLSNEHEVPLCTNYNDIRTKRLPEPLYPTGVLLMDEVQKTDSHRKESLKKAIPEFLKYNIVESEIRDVC